MLTKAEAYYLDKLEQWENERKSERSIKILHLYSDYIDTGLSYLPEWQKQKIVRSFNNILFHLHAILINSTFQRNTAQKIMQQARVHNESIFTLRDMTKLSIDQLQSIAEKLMAHYRMLASVKGLWLRSILVFSWAIFSRCLLLIFDPFRFLLRYMEDQLIVPMKS